MTAAARILIATVFLALVLPATAGPRPAGIHWRPNLGSAMTEARKGNRLVMIDFYTDWCGWCKKLDATTFKDQRVVELSKQVIPVKVKAQGAGEQAAQLYRVSSFPTILFVNRLGKVVHHVSGFRDAKQFTGEIKNAVRTHQAPEK